MTKKIKTPINKQEIIKLKAGDEVLLTGTIYTARDQAHKRIVDAKKLPAFLKGQLIYYCAPTPPKPDGIIGSCGPTTASRMDKFTPNILKYGVFGVIGKGKRSQEVKDAIKKYKSVYFVTIAGAGAYLSKNVIGMKTAGFGDLGPEAIWKLEVRDFPLYVAIDSKGNSIY